MEDKLSKVNNEPDPSAILLLPFVNLFIALFPIAIFRVPFVKLVKQEIPKVIFDVIDELIFGNESDEPKCKL